METAPTEIQVGKLELSVTDDLKALASELVARWEETGWTEAEVFELACELRNHNPDGPSYLPNLVGEATLRMADGPESVRFRKV